MHVFAQAPLTAQETALAKVGPRTITARDLLERIDLMPWPGKDQPALRDSVVRNALLSLVAEKLLSLEASGLGLGRETDIASGLTTLERAFARDELFRQEIVAQVNVTPEEIDQAYQRYASELVLAVFAVSSEADARSLVRRLMAGSEAAGRALPSPHVHSRDTISITCGTLVQAHEDVAYAIRNAFDARPSYTVSSGWLVFRLLDRRPNPAATRLSPTDRRTTVENLLRKRRQAELTVHYFNRYIGGEAIRMDSALFHAIAETLLAVIRVDEEAHRKGTGFGVTGDDVKQLLRAFAAGEHLPFVSLRTDTVRLAPLLRGMALHPVQVRSLNPRIFKEDINRALMTVAEAELMSEWALRQHYNDHPDVRRDLSAWMEATQTQELVRKIIDSLHREQNVDSALTTGARDPLDEYIARLANKYGVEIEFQKVKELNVTPFNMVTRRYIGFGGTLPAVPVLPHLWEWYVSWKKDRVSTP